jgi:hypothetical protein
VASVLSKDTEEATWFRYRGAINELTSKETTSRRREKKNENKPGSQSGLPGPAGSRVWPGQFPACFLLRPGPATDLDRPSPGSTRRAGPGFKTLVWSALDVSFNIFYFLF